VTRIRALVAVMMALGLPAPASADWLLTAIAGTTVRTTTGFVDLDSTAANRHPIFGVSMTVLSSGVFGVETEATIVPSIFTGHQLVDSSRVVTAGASLVLAVPRRMLRIRPYAVVGADLVRTTTDAVLLPIASTLPAMHFGGGVWVPVARRVAVRADVRFMRTTTGDDGAFALHDGYVETWRITAGVAWRFR
jgi:Outer membrane protein beta-barrel domain